MFNNPCCNFLFVPQPVLANSNFNILPPYFLPMQPTFYISNPSLPTINLAQHGNFHSEINQQRPPEHTSQRNSTQQPKVTHLKNSKIKKIKKSTKNRSEKKVFKNIYLSYALHKLMFFISEKYISDMVIRASLECEGKSSQDINSLVKTFYQQHIKVSRYVVANCSIKKVRQLWTGTAFDFIKSPPGASEIAIFTSIYRRLSKVFFELYYTPFLLRSKKVKKESLPLHQKMRTYLLENVRCPKEFKVYWQLN